MKFGHERERERERERGLFHSDIVNTIQCINKSSLVQWSRQELSLWHEKLYTEVQLARLF